MGRQDAGAKFGKAGEEAVFREKEDLVVFLRVVIVKSG